MKPILLIALLSFAVLYFKALRNWLQQHGAKLRVMLCCLGVLLPVLFVAGGAVSVVTQRPTAHDEVTVLSIAAAFLHGQPMYPAADAAAEYSLLYGPVAYLVYLPPMLLGAVRFGAFQAWALLPLALAFLLLWSALRRLVSSTVAFASLAFLVVALIPLADSLWATKGDGWIVFFGALAFWAAVSRVTWQADLLIALCGAAMIDIKITLIPHALLPFLVLWQHDHRPWLRRLPALVVMALLAMAPFGLAGVQMGNYRAVLAAAAHHGLSSRMLAINRLFLEYSFLLPFAASVWAAAISDWASFRSWLRDRRSLLACTALCTLISLFSGAKNGAGPWHLLPVAIPLVLLQAELWQKLLRAENNSRIAWAYPPLLGVLGALLLNGPDVLQQNIENELHDQQGTIQISHGDVQNDVLAIAARYPNEVLQMGYSDASHYDLTFTRQVLILKGNPLFVDADVRNELDLSNTGYAPAVLQALASCKVTLWLVPRGGEPFSLQSQYFGDPAVAKGTVLRPELFVPPFQRIFFQHYRKIPSTSRYFNLWACARPGESLPQ